MDKKINKSTCCIGEVVSVLKIFAVMVVAPIMFLSVLAWLIT